MSNKKILNLSKKKDANFFNLIRKEKKIVLCHGVFDLLHYGHIQHLKEAKKYGDLLIVSITSDKFVNKGPSRPYFNFKQRSESLLSLNCVDYVVESKGLSSVEIINVVKPQYYCKGKDYTNLSKDYSKKIILEKKAVEKNYGKIVFTTSKLHSSSKLLNNEFIFNEDQILFLKNIKKKFSIEMIIKIIDNFYKIKPVIVGEIIIDAYNFCSPLGKSGKEPVLVFKHLKKETYQGGSLAIAKHLSDFCNKIDLISYIGEKQEFLNNIKKNNISINLVNKKNSPTIEKIRFVENNTYKKLMGIYNVNDDFLSAPEEKKILSFFDKIIKKDSILIVTDYGHGLFTKKITQRLNKYKNFKSLNCQVNSSSIGYHSIKNFKNFDLIIFNEIELRYELRDKNQKIEFLIKKFARDNTFKYLVVTRGKLGCILYNNVSKKFFYAPGFARNIVDKIGAGDAMIPFMTILLHLTKSEELALLISSFTAAELIAVDGNKISINKYNLIKSIEHALKI